MNEKVKDSLPNSSSNNSSNNEDVRVTKLLRRLNTEDSIPGWVDLCKKLEVAIHIPMNTAYISRSFENLLDYVLAALKKCPTQCFTQFCSLVGLMAYIGRASFAIFEEFIRKTYKTNKRIQTELALTLKSTLSCDTGKHNLDAYSENIIRLLKEFIENVEAGDIFIIITGATVIFSKNYPYTFERHFTDIVDIVIGWHLELKEPKYVRDQCAYVLQEFAPYFTNKLHFTFGLLAQFVEDISVLNDLITKNCPAILGIVGENSFNLPNEAIYSFQRIGGFVGAFNSLFKSLLQSPNFSFTPSSKAIVIQALRVGSDIFIRLLGIKKTQFEAINNINELYCVCIIHNFDPMNMIGMENIIKLELKHIMKFNDEQKLVILYLTLSFVQRQRAKLTTDFVKLIFNPQHPDGMELQMYLDSIKLKTDGHAYKLIMRIYKEILLIKNVPLLQEAYLCLTHDINRCIVAVTSGQITNMEMPKTMEVETRLNFNLSALTALATQTASIIAMYACNPSILDLLVTNFRANEFKIWVKNPTIHHSIILTLIAHCENNHNYRNTSRLLQLSGSNSGASSGSLSDRTSPTAENFTKILRFLGSSLKQADIINKETLSDLLQWTCNLLTESKENAVALSHNNDFINICKAVSGHMVEFVPRQCGACIKVLLDYEEISSDLLILYRDTALKQLDKPDVSMHSVFSDIYAKLPLRITLQLNITNYRLQDDMTCNYRMMESFAGVHEKYLKMFLDNIQDIHDKSLLHTVELCFSERVLDETNNNKVIDKFLTHTSKSERMLVGWMQFELARYLVEQKLRTFIGKPQDTFLAIEAIIKKYALAMQNLNNNNIVQQQNYPQIDYLYTQRNMRFLLEFIEALEKHVYNAAEGFAFAFAPPMKTVHAFFRLNISTCQSWFSRIIPAIIMLGIHSMEPESVIRYSEQILMTVQPSDVHFIQSLVYMTWALLACNESDSLHGLYLLARSKTGKRYYWIQMAAEQAAGHKEVAINGYKTLLNENHLDNLVRQFIIAQLQDCLYYTAQWYNLRAFKQHFSPEEANQFNPFTQAQNSYMSKIDEIMANYESQSLNGTALAKGLYDMAVWPETTSSNTLVASALCDPFTMNFLQTVENHCVDQLIAKPNGNIFLPECLEQSLELCWRETMLSKSTGERYRNDTIIMKYLTNALKNNYDFCTIKTNMMCNESKCSINNNNHNGNSIPVLIKCLSWLEILEKRTNTQNSNQGLNSMYLDVAASARKEGNYNCCQSMLTRFFTRHNCAMPLRNISAKLINDLSYKVNIADNELLRGFNEIAKWLYVQEKPTEIESINLMASLCYRIHESLIENTEILNYTAMSSSMLLLLSDWLTQRIACNGNTPSPTVDNTTIERLVGVLPVLSLSDMEFIPESDKIIGKIINASISQYEVCDEAWVAYGNWCYRWGKKKVESRSNDNSCLLSTDEIDEIKEIIGDEKLTDTSIIYQLVAKLNNHINDNSEDIDLNDDYSSSTEQLKTELKNFSFLKDKPESTIEEIIKIWRKANKSIYEYYEGSARAYFHYLMLKAPGGHNSNVCNSTAVTTTLRLLRLIVKHSSALQDVLEAGLKLTPIQPWKVIIPQLFSRLSHHEPYVRKSISDLLCRLAKNTPHLVIFPAVVGARREHTTLRNQINESATQTDRDKSTVQLNYCFSSLLNTLSKYAPQTVVHVELLVKELRRICLLWDEYWIHSLAQIYTRYLPRINAIGQEMKANDIEGKTKRFNVFRQQIIENVLRVAEFTSREAETSYEYYFKRRFEAQINNTIEVLQSAKFPEAWDRLKQLYTFIMKNSIRGGASYLKMQNLSPVLSKMSNSDIMMPGVNPYEREPIYIRGVDNIVRILPTKTKPKKVAFLGSNGRKYTFLFKSHEDLHLDERIMQFLQISNSIMASNRDAGPGREYCFQARHYSVIPLGSQSGLISWVDGVTPIFGVYKKWQHRQAQMKMQAKKRLENEDTNAAQDAVDTTETIVPTKRLTELFYGKLTPLLDKHKMKVTDPRKQWPLSVLKQTLSELALETPRDLLVRELWGHSNNAIEYRQLIRKYTASLAVMSVIGYIIGLGDRHLDNMLISLKTGEIVHIDYNVCFEKGKTLRIPEKVPFRMTQNLIEALGVTGIEGSFRLGCEYVMKALRKERETLLTLLEAFVYDPLVDWTVTEDIIGNKALTAKDTALIEKPQAPITGKRYDWEQSLQHVGKKIGEIQNSWLQYSHDIHTSLKNVALNLNDILVGRADVNGCETELGFFLKQVALVREIESLGSAMSSHSFNTAAQRYKVKKHDTEAMHLALSNSESEYKHITQTIALYETIIHDPTTLINLKEKLYKQKLNSNANDWRTEYNLVCEVLEESQKELNEYQSVRHEINELRTQGLDIAIECIEQLNQYKSVVLFFPVAYLKRNPYLLFHYTFGLHTNQPTEDQQSSFLMHDIWLNEHGNTLENKQVLEALYKLEKVWLEMKYDLRESDIQLDNTKRLPISDKEVAVQDIQDYNNVESNRRSGLYYVFGQVVKKSSEAFVEFETELLTTEEPNLLTEQLEYVNIVCIMMESIMIGSDRFKHFSNLQATLQTMLDLRDLFQFDLPQYVTKLFLTNQTNHKTLEKFCIMGSNNLHNEYQLSLDNDDDTIKKSLFDGRKNDFDFFNILNKISKQFQLLKSNLEQLKFSAQMTANRIIDEALKHKLNTDILCNNPSDLKLKLIFDVIHQCLLVAHDYDVRSFALPINSFIYFIERNYIIGLIQLFAFDIYVGSRQEPNDNIEDRNEMEYLSENFFMSLERNLLVTQQERQIHYITECLNLVKATSSALFWSNENMLYSNFNGHIIQKENLMEDISKNACMLTSLIESMGGLQSKMTDHIGALEKEKSDFNQNHIEGLLRNENKQQLFDEASIALMKQVVDSAKPVCVYEKFALNEDEIKRLKIIESWNTAYTSWQHSKGSITSVEEANVELLHPEGNIDRDWVNNIMGLLDEEAYMVHRRIADSESQLQVNLERMHAAANSLKKILDATKISDMRVLINIISKGERNGKNVLNLPTRLQDHQAAMKTYCNKLREIRQTILEVRDDTTTVKLKELQETLNSLLNSNDVNELNESFVGIKECIKHIDELKALTTLDQQSLLNKTVVNQNEQKRNAYGVSVWKKIRMKLEGRDPDPNRRANVTEQVDHIISEATNIDNLAVLYEGWTPWV